MFRDVAAATVVSFIATVVAAPLLIPTLARVFRVDVPGERSSHVVATPRGGGVLVAVGLIAGWLWGVPFPFVLTGAALTAFGFGLLGLLDDLRPLGAKWRLLGQGALAAVSIIWLERLAPDGLAGVAFCLATVVVVVGFVNSFNFMDGINGISAIHAAVAGLTFAAVAWHLDSTDLAVFAAAIGGAAVGFLPANFRRTPKVFLGDVGSYLLGAVIVACAIVVWRSGATIEAAGAPLALYVTDTATTVLRRLRRGDDIFDAHREHAYQRLTPSGSSHVPAALLTGGVTLALSAIGFSTMFVGTFPRLALAVVSVSILVAYVRIAAYPRAVQKLHGEPLS